MPCDFLGREIRKRMVKGIVNDPPSEHSRGEIWIVGDEPTGIFVGHEEQLAISMNSEWRFICPDIGFKVYNEATEEYLYNSGRGWLSLPPPLPGGSASWGAITGTLSDQTDLNSALAGKSAVGHDHDSVYAPLSHNHDSVYAPIGHNHDSVYSAIGHTHGQLHDRSHSITSSSDHSFPGGTTTFLRADGSFAAPGGGSDPWTVVKLASDFTTNGTANTNVTGLFFTPAAGKTYIVYGAFLLRTATATVGARPGVAWPTVSDGGAWIDVPNSLTAAAMRIWGARTTQNAASTGLADTASSHYSKLEALIVSGASPSGNFQVTLASETSGTNVTMKAGSYIMYREI